MISEGYGLDYRMWHLPLCLSCMNAIAGFGESFVLNQDFSLKIHIPPHSLKEEETLRLFGESHAHNGLQEGRTSPLRILEPHVA
jgi:hypothetical protein